MKLRVLALVLAAGAAAHASPGRAQSGAPAGRLETTVRNPNPHRGGPSTGISFGISPYFSTSGMAMSYPAVIGLVKGGPGERAGLVVGDTIRAVNGRDARQPPLFPNRVPGARYVVRVRRGGEEREVVLVLPDSTPAAPQHR